MVDDCDGYDSPEVRLGIFIGADRTHSITGQVATYRKYHQYYNESSFENQLVYKLEQFYSKAFCQTYKHLDIQEYDFEDFILNYPDEFYELKVRFIYMFLESIHPNIEFGEVCTLTANFFCYFDSQFIDPTIDIQYKEFITELVNQGYDESSKSIEQYKYIKKNAFGNNGVALELYLSVLNTLVEIIIENEYYEDELDLNDTQEFSEYEEDDSEEYTNIPPYIVNTILTNYKQISSIDDVEITEALSTVSGKYISIFEHQGSDGLASHVANLLVDENDLENNLIYTAIKKYIDCKLDSLNSPEGFYTTDNTIGLIELIINLNLGNIDSVENLEEKQHLVYNELVEILYSEYLSEILSQDVIPIFTVERLIDHLTFIRQHVLPNFRDSLE